MGNREQQIDFFWYSAHAYDYEFKEVSSGYSFLFLLVFTVFEP